MHMVFEVSLLALIYSSFRGVGNRWQFTWWMVLQNFERTSIGQGPLRILRAHETFLTSVKWLPTSPMTDFFKLCLFSYLEPADLFPVVFERILHFIYIHLVIKVISNLLNLSRDYMILKILSTQ